MRQADSAAGPGCDHRDAAAWPERFLICQAWSTGLVDGRWRFSIESADGDPILEAGDEEPGDLNRLTLLAAIRGLEAIDGPASVVLFSTNRYLIRSLGESLPRWRAGDFSWEHFGRVIEIQHAELWRRIDRALSIHRVEACLMTRQLVSHGLANHPRGDQTGDGWSGEASGRVDASRPSARKRLGTTGGLGQPRRDSGHGLAGPHFSIAGAGGSPSSGRNVTSAATAAARLMELLRADAQPLRPSDGSSESDGLSRSDGLSDARGDRIPPTSASDGMAAPSARPRRGGRRRFTLADLAEPGGETAGSYRPQSRWPDSDCH